ncbi:CBS domain-containing protein [Deinococcus aestuarii]|uniref:CBS domain-containing protein n=1 Tax=Deinococcus aestuarii TaxID=2774531 RepID=UPI001C0C2F5F|nr:CBS domain-containing protein [Deinococcus aestuarii]
MSVTVAEVKSPQVVSVPAHEPLPAAVVKMDRLGLRRLPVLHGGRLVGIVTAGDVRRGLPRLRDPWAFTAQVGRMRVQDVMHSPVLTARVGEDLRPAVARMLAGRVGGLPVLDKNGTLAGMLTRKDVLRAEVRRPRLTWGSVAQHMKREVLTVTAQVPAEEALRRLRETGRHVLPVLEGEHLVGVVHARDLEAEAEREELDHVGSAPEAPPVLAGRSVRDLMRPPSGYVLGSAPMHRAMERMLEAEVYGLPVIGEDGVLLGVVTVSDVLSTVLGDWRGEEEAPA